MFRKNALILLGLLLLGCTKSSDSSLSLPYPPLLDDSEANLTVKYASEASKLLEAHDYDGLEKLAVVDRALVSPFGSGASPIMAFYDAIAGDPNSATPEAYDQELSVLNDWSTARPDSVTAKIAVANAEIDYAWFVRGAGYANTVNRQGWSDFEGHLANASHALLHFQDKRQLYPDWYYTMATVGLGQGWNKEKYLGLTQECTSLYRLSSDPYSSTVIYLLPRWYGSNPELVDFITKSADKLGGEESDMLYARLARTLWTYSFDINPFDDVGLSWPRVKNGMEFICRRYPHSTYMVGCFCALACKAHDHDTARALFKYLGSQFVGGAWPTQEEFEKAKAWAQ